MSADAPEVVLHAAADGALPRARAAAERLVEAIPGIRVHIVANGDALVDVTTPAPDQDGVQVVACSIAMAARGIAQESLPDDVGTVPSASVFIVEKQLAGAAYLRV